MHKKIRVGNTDSEACYVRKSFQKKRQIDFFQFQIRHALQSALIVSSAAHFNFRGDFLTIGKWWKAQL